MKIRTCVVSCLSVLVAACSLFSRTESQFYMIESTRLEGPTASFGGPPLGIEAVVLPPGLDRRSIVVRKGEQELEIRETHQWAALLERMVLHALAHDIAARLPVGMVVLPGQPRPDGPMQSISVVFDDFVAGPENRLVLDARWTHLGSGVSVRERVEIEMSSLESSEVATAMGRALDELATRIVGELGN